MDNGQITWIENKNQGMRDVILSKKGQKQYMPKTIISKNVSMQYMLYMSTSDNKYEKYPESIDGNFFAVMFFR